jgi:protein-S-isoprenylcysteine O-methyltransferase Ste14
MSQAGTLVHEHKTWWDAARGTVGILILIPFGVLAAISAPWSWTSPWASFQFKCLAWVLFLAGGTFRFWATLYIGGHKGKTVVSEGPYSICRNPLYLGNFFLTLSAAVFVESLTFTVGVMVATVVFLSTTVSSEERRLRERLGDDYVAYCQRTPRFWPSLKHFHTSPTVLVDVKCLGIESVRALRWALIPVIAEAIWHLRMEAWWPHLLQLP